MPLESEIIPLLAIRYEILFTFCLCSLKFWVKYLGQGIPQIGPFLNTLTIFLFLKFESIEALYHGFRKVAKKKKKKKNQFAKISEHPFKEIGRDEGYWGSRSIRKGWWSMCFPGHSVKFSIIHGDCFRLP